MIIDDEREFMTIRESARQKVTTAYLNRLNELNVGAETKTVFDSIDRPMRPLILELHRIGLETTFCCCGFSYEGEEEPKSHHASFTYVFIKQCVKSELAKDNANKFFSTLVNNTSRSWQIGKGHMQTPTGEPLIHLFFENPLKNLYQTSPDLPSIHDYESHKIIEGMTIIDNVMETQNYTFKSYKSN